MPRQLTDQEQEEFDAIRHAPNIGLIQTAFDGEETAVIAAFNAGDDGDTVEVTPMAVMLTDAMTDKLTDPTQDLEDTPA